MAHSSTAGGGDSEPLVFEMAGLSVSGLWTHATDPIAVAAVAHGAGAGMTHPFMAGVAEGLASARVSVLRFNFPYMDARRRTPDAPPMLV
jgi:predicted alpha/beta-hydrolase family hydrolase